MVMLSSIRSCLRAASKGKKGIPGRKDSNREVKFKPSVMPVFEYPVADSTQNRLYMWGLVEHGALGTFERTMKTEGVNCIAKPSRSTFAEFNKVYNMACGYGFSAFAVRGTEAIVYGCGINTDSQIGVNIKDKKYPHDIILKPRPINLPLQNKSEHVIDISAGRAHLLVLTNEGLYTLGNNGYGQCGRPIIKNENYKQSTVINYIPNIKGMRMVAVAAGQDHSMVITEKGEVYTFGWGADGQTGLAHYHNEYNPTLVKGDLAGEKVKKVAGAADCVLALTEKGKVYGWGNSEYNQFPVQGDTYQLNVATELKMCEEAGYITDIAAGGTFCMILNNEGNVFTWGYGILGHGPEVQMVPKPTQVPSIFFGQNEFQPNVKVDKIFCGLSYSAALTNTGELYMWGRNKFGSLGFGHLKDQHFPLKVSIGAHVKKVACGVDHTLALCRAFV